MTLPLEPRTAPPATLEGVLERVVFVNEENAWSVVRLAVSGRQDLVTAVGNLLGPGAQDLASALGADAAHLGEPFRLVLDDFQSVHPEGGHQARGHDLADAPDEPRAQVLLDAGEGGGGDRGVGGDPELPSVLRVVDPAPGQPQALARLHA